MPSAARDLLNALVVGENGERWGDRATDVQRRDAEALLDAEGPRRHWIGRSRGYSKTDDLASITIAVMLEQLRNGAEAIGVASDRDQARILVDRMRRIAERTPELRGALEAQNYAVIAPRVGVKFEVIAADGPSSWGRSPAWTVCDELAQWPDSTNARTVWQATSTSAVKVRGRLAIITTPGDPSHWARSIYDGALSDPLWRVSETFGPAPWLDRGELESERRRLPESAWQRLFEGRWCATEDRLFGFDAVQACAVLPGRLDPDTKQRYVIGVDLAIRRDRAAVAVCHAEPASEERGADRRIVVDSLDVFEASRRHDIDLGVVEECIASRSRAYNAAPVIFDPAMAGQMMQRLRARGLRVVEHTFSASSNSKRALTLLELVREGRLWLPDEPEVVNEFAALRLVERAPGVYRYDHDRSGHDDQVTAIGLAAVHLLDQPTYHIPDDFTFFATPPTGSRWSSFGADPGFER